MRNTENERRYEWSNPGRFGCPSGLFDCRPSTLYKAQPSKSKWHSSRLSRRRGTKKGHASQVKKKAENALYQISSHCKRLLQDSVAGQAKDVQMQSAASQSKMSGTQVLDGINAICPIYAGALSRLSTCIPSIGYKKDSLSGRYLLGPFLLQVVLMTAEIL